LTVAAAPGDIVNDRLDTAGIGRPNAVDRFKNKVLRQCARSRKLLLDIGSASGRFLYQNRDGFEQTLGIEVSPDCVSFSRKLGLDIATDLAGLEREVAVATFWHSLEHLPAEVLGAMLARIRECALPETVMIVSVPNAASLQYALLRQRFAFYDPAHHYQQFTPASLDLLLAGYGFARKTAFASFAYASFGWLQGLLNLFNRRQDYLYYRRKRGWTFGLAPGRRRWLDAYNLFLVCLLLAPSFLLSLLDLWGIQRGGVLTVCYRRKTPST
jgi:hypothetical protein